MKNPAPTKEAPTKTANLVEVTLIDAHTHNGKRLAKGEKLRVSARRRDWLIKHEKVAGPVSE